MTKSRLTELIKNDWTEEAIVYINNRTTAQLNFEEVDDEGKTPFHWAALKQNVRVTKALAGKLSEWALNLTDNEGKTAVNYASIVGTPDLVEAASGITRNQLPNIEQSKPKITPIEEQRKLIEAASASISSYKPLNTDNDRKAIYASILGNQDPKVDKLSTDIPLDDCGSVFNMDTSDS